MFTPERRRRLRTARRTATAGATFNKSIVLLCVCAYMRCGPPPTNRTMRTDRADSATNGCEDSIKCSARPCSRYARCAATDGAVGCVVNLLFSCAGTSVPERTAVSSLPLKCLMVFKLIDIQKLRHCVMGFSRADHTNAARASPASAYTYTHIRRCRNARTESAYVRV